MAGRDALEALPGHQKYFVFKSIVLLTYTLTQEVILFVDIAVIGKLEDRVVNCTTYELKLDCVGVFLTDFQILLVSGLDLGFIICMLMKWIYTQSGLSSLQLRPLTGLRS